MNLSDRLEKNPMKQSKTKVSKEVKVIIGGTEVTISREAAERILEMESYTFMPNEECTLLTNNKPERGCPIRVHPYGKGDEIPLCPEPFCMHTLLPGETICPCHTPPQEREMWAKAVKETAIRRHEATRPPQEKVEEDWEELREFFRSLDLPLGGGSAGYGDWKQHKFKELQSLIRQNFIPKSELKKVVEEAFATGRISAFEGQLEEQKRFLRGFGYKKPPKKRDLLADLCNRLGI